MLRKSCIIAIVPALAAVGNACSTGGYNVAGSGGATTAEDVGHPRAGGATFSRVHADTGTRATLGGGTESGGTRGARTEFAVGGIDASGGQLANGGAATGVATAGGGRHVTAGGAGGRLDARSTATAGGAMVVGGGASAGGNRMTGGTSSLGTSPNLAASGGSATAGAPSAGPCDIYAADNAPCVAAHSTVRALFGAYSGHLYQVRRASDKTTTDIPVIAPGRYAKSSVQDSFCSKTTCTISVIYDQSHNGNHFTTSPPGGWLNNGSLEADATAAKITMNGHTVYGVYTTGSFDNDIGGVGYRNNKTKGVATGDQPESMYMVVSGRHYNQWCCFDYGNAETNNLDNGNATMEAVYFGNSTQWGRGSGGGPWVMADLENGVFAGSSFAAPATNTSIVADYVTAMLKGPSGNRFMLKGASAQSPTLETKYDGPRPNGYCPMKKEGAIILGTGGDNSHTGEGTFFEGCITTGVPTDAADSAVQFNIAAAGYGR